ncbi:NADPH-dependent 2,4-dienoyl-CoA reductase/sulfur reductase-like enzyme [Aeromicrobium panaciterrae]|uniref:NADPH-dependent 2,4-dienoyl-CoA reductase/sulfur reductase-like enzyme n=1 Tax=Aeromicrobium panaciterrae TaxID=363861 RepID=A0ABU1ULN3_9ACTN|nr:FAD-dependent oxidoreductase [Aeromicrobium panaciterrae]MDR7086080.1 NADPH-dependent 2,4-dienoyl-CoA reductase/sulfur reductase-like enzyme [Aeromicrobium panaciterrae]
MRTVIVGAGIAGVSAAGALRASGREGEIVLVGDEPELPYRRPPVSKEIVRGEKTTDEIRIKKAEWFADQQITLRTGVTVTSIGDGTVELDGERLSYDQLLLATGGRARNPWDALGIRTLRSVADVPRLQFEMAAGKHLIVVGAGLIGSEIAASARGLGCEVTLLETANVPLPRLLPPELAQMYVDLHKAEGTDLHTNVTVESITDEGETVVRADDGRSWSGPVVVVAVGMEPNVSLAEQVGLAIAPAEDGGGILVDEFGHTSASGIFAAGDVANQPNLVLGGRHRVEHWQGAQNHGASVGKNMAGLELPFAEVPWCWSDQYGHTLQVVGWPLATHELVVRGSLAEHDFTAYLLEDGVVRGAVAMGRPGEIRTARTWIADGARLEDVLA